jgi:hypothetical protein
MTSEQSEQTHDGLTQEELDFLEREEFVETRAEQFLNRKYD